MFGFSRIISGQNSLCPAKRAKLAAFDVGMLKGVVGGDWRRGWVQVRAMRQKELRNNSRNANSREGGRGDSLHPRMQIAKAKIHCFELAFDMFS
jgi:hypothetical protein